MRKYGIKGKEYKWFVSYLHDRKQRTRVNQTLSDAIEVELGVPQGSVLGTLLFLFYINDMADDLEYAKLALFADDALLYIAAETVDECVRRMNMDLAKLAEWLKSNKLKLNAEKTKVMSINCEIGADIVIDGEIIEQVDEIKYLGVVIDRELNFKSHINYISKKIAKKVGFLSRIRKRISTLSAIKIYNTMIKPHFEYCSTVIFMGTDEMKSRLQKMQNRAMRVILLCNKLTPIKDMLGSLKWLSVNQRTIMNVLIFIFKIKNGLLPKYLSTHIRYVGEVQPFRLRNARDFRLNTYKNKKTQNMLIYKGLKLYNEIPNNIKAEGNFKRFKSELITYIKIRFD